MSDTTLNKFFQYGTAAARAAFTPSPAAGIAPIYIWYETDTDNFYVYTTAWHGPYTGGGSTGTGGLSTTTTLTAAQVKALNATPITLIAAPGAGKITIVNRITLASTFGTVAYTGANNLEFRYTGAAGAKVTADIAAATLNFAAGTQYSTVAGVTTELVPVANAIVCVRVPTANPAAGDSIVKLRADYQTLTLP